MILNKSIIFRLIIFLFSILFNKKIKNDNV